MGAEAFPAGQYAPAMHSRAVADEEPTGQKYPAAQTPPLEPPHSVAPAASLYRPTGHRIWRPPTQYVPGWHSCCDVWRWKHTTESESLNAANVQQRLPNKRIQVSRGQSASCMRVCVCVCVRWCGGSVCEPGHLSHQRCKSRRSRSHEHQTRRDSRTRHHHRALQSQRWSHWDRRTRGCTRRCTLVS
jgi:hypothetical protein